MAWYETALVSAAATLVAASAAVLVAILQVRNLRRIARTRATLDFILKYESDAFYLAAVEAFRAFHKGDFTAAEAISPPNDDVRRQAAHLSAFLNFQELIALGIRHGALDRSLFSDWWASSYVKLWNAVRPLTRLQRDRSPKALVEFEALARAFAKERGIAFEEAAASEKRPE